MKGGGGLAELRADLDAQFGGDCAHHGVVVDGVVAASEGLPGKPNPATYEYAARLLDLPSEECVVVEDAVSGVQAGEAGSFHSVIGVDRGAGRQTLLDAGATLVVNDLKELLP